MNVPKPSFDAYAFSKQPDYHECDARLIRESPGTPKHVNVYGYLYDIDTQELLLVVEEKPAVAR